MSRRRSARRRGRQPPALLDQLATPRHRTSLPVLLWRWRKELALLAIAAAVLVALAHALGVTWAVAGLSVMIGMLSPPWSERLKACGWQFITPHLLRSGLREAGISNLKGHLPVIVRITREPFGERVHLWCPAGICAEDLQAARCVLRAACWAADVRVTRDERRSHMVIVDVIRRRDDARWDWPAAPQPTR